MDEGKIKELEAKLREMFELKDQPLSKPGRRTKPAENVVIRRRKGQKDKRILLSNAS